MLKKPHLSETSSSAKASGGNSQGLQHLLHREKGSGDSAPKTPLCKGWAPCLPPWHLPAPAGSLPNSLTYSHNYPTPAQSQTPSRVRKHEMGSAVLSCRRGYKYTNTDTLRESSLKVRVHCPPAASAKAHSPFPLSGKTNSISPKGHFFHYSLAGEPTEPVFCAQIGGFHHWTWIWGTQSRESWAQDC